MCRNIIEPVISRNAYFEAPENMLLAILIDERRTHGELSRQGKLAQMIDSHELLKMMQDDLPMDGWNFIKFPSHTQAVERMVKLFTEASRKRVGPQNRDGFVRATLESRKQMSQFESKTRLQKIMVL
ncbi:hypothetical protein AVEN_223061-1 [Araneus ventricosus]|uniref:Uncharacterized protein n=1 Tax=Araneus ventricosus TaxID=182803 RepID=A0A4Y2FX54_ARAVE|nr:hypothetical protein AVEN_223061-1 [Araneus ventricosus]